MQKLGSGSDLGENHEEESHLLAKAKKRLREEISKGSSDTVILEEDFFERKKTKDFSDIDKDDGERILIQIKDPSKEEHKTTDTPIKLTKAPSNNVKPTIWMNRLKYYSSEPVLENTISFRELMHEDLLRGGPSSYKKSLESILMTSFRYDYQLLEPIVKEGVKLILVSESDSPSNPKVEKNILGYSNFTLIQLAKNNYLNFIGAFRAKLWILKFPTFIRVVVSTGDPIPLDWTIWSNFLWFRDFHEITESDENRPFEKKKSKDDEFNFDEDFKSTLKSFLGQMMPSKINYADMLGFSIDNYLFEKIDIVLIASAPGRYRDKDFDKFGSRKIGLVLRKLIGKSMDSKHDYMLTYQTNSFGNLNEKFLKEFLGSVFPNFINIDELKAERRYKKTLTPSGNELYRRVRVVFPTKEFIDKSIEGPEYSGCLALSSDCYHNNSFPKNVFYKYETSEKYSLYPGILPHHNMFAVTNMKGEINDDTYMYFGSHNLSAAAWGKYEKDYGQLSINNFEFGVLIPPGKGTKLKKKQIIENLPFKFAATAYQGEDVPWISEIHLKEEESE